MNAAEIVAVVIATSLLVGGASYGVFRLVGVELRRRHLEVGTAIFLQAGVIYAVFLAFVFGQALTSYVDADNAIDQECAALHGASILAHTLPDAPRTQLAQALETYLTAVVEDEWHVMRETRGASMRAQDAEIALLETASAFNLQKPEDIAAQSRVIGLLIDAHRFREERIFQAGQGIPSGLWAMILVYCGVLIALVFFSSLEYAWSHAALSGIFGGLNAIVLLACFLLQYPFDGPFALSSQGFVATEQRVAATLSP